LWRQRERRREARDGLEKTMWSYNTPEAEAARYLIAEIKKAVENAEPNLRPMVSEIAAQIMRDLDTLALSTREHQ
jgi:hypothetical protein